MVWKPYEEKGFQAWSRLAWSTLETSSLMFWCRIDERFSRIVKKLCDWQDTRTSPGRYPWRLWQWIALWSMHAAWKIWRTFTVVERFGHEKSWHSNSIETHSSTEVLNTKCCVDLENDRCTSCWIWSERETKKNQPIRALWHWYLDYKTFERRHFHRCSLNLVVFFVELMVVSIPCLHFLKTLLFLNGTQVHIIEFSFCNHTTKSFKFVTGVWLCSQLRQQAP